LLRAALELFTGTQRGFSLVWSLYLKKFQPFHPSVETVEPYESLPRQNLTLGNVQWTGWVLGENDIWVLEERGHTSDEVLFYIPEHKLLFTADLTFPLFPTFPDTNGALTRTMLQKCKAVASAGVVSILADSHFPRVYRGRDEACEYLDSIVTEHDAFQAVLKQILAEHDGVSVGEVYGYVRQRIDDSTVRHYLSLEYPHLPMSLQQIIAVSLSQMGYLARGPKGKKRFFRAELQREQGR
jgi:glyoxylase-like metal-dependent hydrolase (beta-lactamase superfamily II)